ASPVTFDHASLRISDFPTVSISASMAQFLRCQMDSLDHLNVAGTPAQVARQRLPNLLIGRRGRAVEQRLGGKDGARRAKATLYRPGLHEAALQRMQVAVFRQPFDGDDIVPIGLPRQYKARVDRLAVHQHSTGSTLALAATGVFSAVQTEIVAQQVEQGLVRFGGDGPAMAVHRQSDGDAVHRMPPARAAAVSSARRSSVMLAWRR